MSDIPNTENVHVAAMAAAIELSKNHSDGSSGNDYFSKRLERFLRAFKAIEIALHANHDVETILEHALKK